MRWYCRMNCRTSTGARIHCSTTKLTFCTHHIKNHMHETTIHQMMVDVLGAEYISYRCHFCQRDRKMKAFQSHKATAEHFITNHADEEQLKCFFAIIDSLFPEEESADENESVYSARSGDSGRSSRSGSRRSSVSGSSHYSANSHHSGKTSSVEFSLPPGALTHAEYIQHYGIGNNLSYINYLQKYVTDLNAINGSIKKPSASEPMETEYVSDAEVHNVTKKTSKIKMYGSDEEEYEDEEVIKQPKPKAKPLKSAPKKETMKVVAPEPMETEINTAPQQKLATKKATKKATMQATKKDSVPDEKKA